MEHPCHKCGQSVEDGIPFCSHCGAPQIRVAIAEATLGGGFSQGETAAASVSATHATSAESPAFLLPIRWADASRTGALAAAVSMLLEGLGLHPLVAMLGCGVLAVALYRLRNPGTMIKASTGARLGAVAGLLSFGMSAVLGAVVLAILHKGPELQKRMLEQMELAAARTGDPQALTVLEQFKTPTGLAVIMVLFFVFAFFLYIILASIGGALGGAFFNRGNRK